MDRVGKRPGRAGVADPHLTRQAGTLPPHGGKSPRSALTHRFLWPGLHDPLLPPRIVLVRLVIGFFYLVSGLLVPCPR